MAKAEEPPIGRLTRWTGSPGNLKNWLMQAACVGRTPESERGHQDPPVSLSYQDRSGHRLAKKTKKPL